MQENLTLLSLNPFATRILLVESKFPLKGHLNPWNLNLNFLKMYIAGVDFCAAQAILCHFIILTFFNPDPFDSNSSSTISSNSTRNAMMLSISVLLPASAMTITTQTLLEGRWHWTETTMLIFQHETTGENCGTSVAFTEILEIKCTLFVIWYFQCPHTSFCPGNIALTRLTLRLRRSVAFLTKRDFLARVELSLSLRFNCQNEHNKQI